MLFPWCYVCMLVRMIPMVLGVYALVYVIPMVLCVYVLVHMVPMC